MKMAALKPGNPPRDIDGFPEGCERSTVGALYLSSAYKPVTDGELAHIKASLPSVYEQLAITEHKDAVSAPPAPHAIEVLEDEQSVAPVAAQLVAASKLVKKR